MCKYAEIICAFATALVDDASGVAERSGCGRSFGGTSAAHECAHSLERAQEAYVIVRLVVRHLVPSLDRQVAIDGVVNIAK